MQSDPPTGVNASPIENNMMQWQAVIFGCVPPRVAVHGVIFRRCLPFVTVRGGEMRAVKVCDTFGVCSPDDTPWEGGTFNLLLEFTEDYPMKAPKVRFVTKMFHPNST